MKCDSSVISLNIDITELSSMDFSDDETHSNAENECRTDDVFQESLQELFTSTHEISSEDIGALLANFSVDRAAPLSVEIGRDGKSEPSPGMAVPIPAALQLHSKFTESEILLQQLSCKLAWTESDLAQVIMATLMSSLLFQGREVGLDLTSKVLDYVCISIWSSIFVVFHMFSYLFTYNHMFSHIFICFHTVSDQENHQEL